MQIDMHHGLIYVLARLADFSPQEATIIAHSSQYVDDATNQGVIRFSNCALYQRTASAHKMLDYRNFRELANHQVWVPFHFLPGDEVRAEDRELIPDFVQRMICRPNSEIAREMMRRYICDQNSGNHLYRLGIALHVYADTWAHQGFAGIDHEVNRVQEILDADGLRDDNKMRHVEAFFHRNIFTKLKDSVISMFINDISPIGHGPVLGFPDCPYLEWGYRDWQGRLIERNNPKDYMEAADHIFTMLSAYRRQKFTDNIETIPASDRQKIEHLITSLTLPDGRDRHFSWLEAIRNGDFSFGSENLSYQAKGEMSWKHEALGTLKHVDDHSEIFEFDLKFLRSHWKQFHDALLYHRFLILHEVLPEKKLCAA
ncbi:MAG: DUF6765 family protein [Oligoflexus sp.]